MVRHAGATNAQALTYDPENRLTAVAAAGVFSDEFGYAADGSRLWKRVNQNPTNVQVWIGNLYEEKGGKVLYHVFAGSEQICSFETNSPLMGGSDTSKVGYYYHEDNLNSSSALSSSSGSQIEVNVYYPFGRVQTASPQASFQVSRRFDGQIFDAESGLYWFATQGEYGRPVDVELGRFIQADDRIPDLSNPQSWNRYSFCVNDPFRYTDPDGHAPEITGLTYTPGSGIEVSYRNHQFGQEYGIGLHTPLEKPTLVMAHDMLVAAANATYDPKVSKGETARLYVAGVSLTILAVTDVVPGGKAVAKPVEEAAGQMVEKEVAAKMGSEIAEGTKVYRVWGGKSGPWGESWTTVNPNTVPNFRSAAGLPDVNTGSFVSEGVLQSTEGVSARGALVIKPGQQGNLPELVIKNAEQKIKLQRVSGANPNF